MHLGRESESRVVGEFVIARSPPSERRGNPAEWIATPGGAGLAMTGRGVGRCGYQVAWIATSGGAGLAMTGNGVGRCGNLAEWIATPGGAGLAMTK